MQTWNKTSKLHYMVCLGTRLQQAQGDIIGDSLPGEIQERLNLLAREGSDGVESASDVHVTGKPDIASSRADD